MRIAVLLAMVALVAGCGSGTEPAAPPTYDLTITYWPAGRGGEPRSATLTCPPGGTHPDPERACDILVSHLNALHPVSRNVACTEIYGGPQVATIAGTIEIEGPLRASFNRSNGCEIARWEALKAVLELPG
jgi:hypothetical protein